MYQPAFPLEFPCILYPWLWGVKQEATPCREAIGPDSNQRAYRFCHAQECPEKGTPSNSEGQAWLLSAFEASISAALFCRCEGQTERMRKLRERRHQKGEAGMEAEPDGGTRKVWREREQGVGVSVRTCVANT